MARGRGKSSTRRGLGRKSARGRAAEQHALPEVYQDMLAAVPSSSPTRASEEGGVFKKRRVGGRMVTQGREHDMGPISTAPENTEDVQSDSNHLPIPKFSQQTAYNSSENSSDSDMAWEEVELKPVGNVEGNDSEGDEDLNLVLKDEASASNRPSMKRKPASAAERRLRLEIHKMHVLSLLVHTHLRNHWCNDEQVQSSLYKLLTKRTISYLNPEENLSQFQRSRSFMDGLEQVRDAFKKKFKITARGMSRPYWAEDTKDLADSSLPEDIDLPTEISDFRGVATKLKGSRDIGAQLFCALLRTAGVEARLVCSLQALPFTMAMRGTTPQKLAWKPRLVVANPDSRTATSEDESAPDVGSDTSIHYPGSLGSNNMPSQVRSKLVARLGRALPVPVDTTSANTPVLPKKPRKKQIRESSYPVYWVEAFNTAIQKWIPVDVLVTNSIAKSSKFEPPASDPENSLVYAVAFEEDGSARDVTRRYAKAYNAKTRRNRVEITKGGNTWWRKVMRMYKRTFDLDQDQVEDAELAAKEAAEGMPRNVQDFKDHPYYALERHLRRNEVINPKRKVGSVTCGKIDKSKNLESIYRRQDVHMVKSADSWYRLGREIKVGEQPLKRVQPRRKREPISDGDSGDEENAGTAMYAAFQTITYQAPPIVSGRVPKNVYGNLDIYVPSMVPEGGVHIIDSNTAKAARILGVDYSDAVTGFEFKGRHGTAVIKGAVIALEYQEAVEEVLQCFDDERIEAEEIRRSLEALRIWKRFLTGLRIKERIRGYEIEGERDEVMEELDEVEEEMEEKEIGGGFMLSVDEPIAQPTVAQFVRRPSEISFNDLGGGFLPGVDEDVNMIVDLEEQARRVLPEDEVDAKDHREEEVKEISTSNQTLNIAATIRETESTGHGRTELNTGKLTAENDSAGGKDTCNSSQSTEQEETSCIVTEPPIRSPPIPRIQTRPADGGGGIMPEDKGNRSDKKESLNITPHAGLPAGELEEPMIMRRIHQAENFLEADNTSQPSPTLRDDAPRKISNSTSVTPESEDDDHGSLLSHDPSDEDADPEWLA